MTASAVVLGTASLATPLAAAAADPDGGFTVPDRPDLPAGEASQRIGADASALRSSGRQSFLLKLDVRSTGRAFLANRSEGKQAAASAGRAQLTRIEATQDSVVEELPARTPVLYRTHAALAGVAVTTNVKNYGALAEIPGVAKVYPIATKTLDNSYAVPLQGGDTAWEAHGDLGAGTRVGIIDTGIDFTHANFGGEGTVAAYDAEHAIADDASLSPASTFPTDKVVGGYDLVGDSYQADPRSPGYQPVPHPDPNPLDCEGHGSHVAGTVAGLGENADGTTYEGDYDTSTPFDSMKIGPGMAPQASLLAFRVFGCAGSTDVAAAAIDRALDPNNDGSTADAVDVINMSLGSDFGSPDDADAIAADAASALGVTMAISSGNSYDLYDVGGSPGTSQQAITVAASVDARSVVDRLNVTGSDAGPRHYASLRSVAYDWTEGDLGGQIVIPEDSATGCDDDPFSAADEAMIDGNVALLTWTDDALECGSVERSANVEAAGGIGFVFASNLEGFNAGITGSEVIPGVLVNKSGGDEIRDLIGDGETVTVDDTEANAVVQNFPDDDNKLTDFSSRGIRGAGHVKPDVAAVGGTVFSTAVGTGSDGVTESGTSMAAPMVAGLAALVVAQHPGWTPEQVKADIMNTAGQDLTTDGVNGGDRYAPNRVGSGRIDAAAALDNDVLAYVTDDPGAVSVSFGPLEVTEPLTLTKTVAVENTGSASATYDTSYDAITTVPGVAYDVAPAQVTVAAGESEEVTVTLTIDDPSELAKTVDPTHGVGDLTPVPDGLPAEYLADASGNLLLTPTSGGAPELRVPVYAAPRPASVMSQESTLDLSAAGEGTLTLSGSGIDQGDGEAHVGSLVAGLELQATSPQAPECSVTVTERCVATSADAGADLRYVGVTSDAPIFDALDLGASNGQAYFGIATHAPHTTAAGKVEFDIYLDVDEDGTSDLVVYNTRVADTDAFLSEVVDLSTGEVVDDEFVNNRAGDVDTAIFDSGVLLMPVWIKPLLDYGVNASAPEVSYAVASYSSSSSNEVDEVGFGADGEPDGSLSANLYEPGVLVTGVGAGGGWWRANSPYGPLLHDEDGAELDVQRDPDTYTGQGVLMVHFHNEAGNQAQVVKLRQTTSVSLTASPASVPRGTPTQLTVTVPSTGGAGVPTGSVSVKNAATGAVVASGSLTNGSASLSWTPTTVGTVQLVASYDGSDTYTSATSAAVPVSVTAASRGVTLGASPTSVVRGAPVALTVAVAQQAGDPVPTGAVSVSDGSGAVVASGALGAGGTATLSFTPTVPGTLTLVASYAGDASTTAGTSAPVAVTVSKAASDVDLDVDGKSGKVGKKVKAVAKVATVNGIAPTGKVQLKDGKKVLDTATLVKGKASFDFKPKKPGTLHLQAVYAGDATYVAGSSSKVTFEVKKAKKPKKGKGKKKG